MKFTKTVNLSKEQIALWEKTFIFTDEENGENEPSCEDLVDTINVAFAKGIEAQLKLYGGYNKNLLLVNGREVDSYDLNGYGESKGYLLGSTYHFHHNDDEYIVLLKEAN